MTPERAEAESPKPIRPPDPPLSRAESIALLLRSCPDMAGPTARLDEVAAELGDFPEALELAGAYFGNLRERAGQPEAYLAELRQVAANERDVAAGIAALPVWYGMGGIRMPPSPLASFDSAVQGDVLTLVGLHHHRLGDLRGAQAAFERALELDEQALGADHPNVARDLNNLGLLRRDRFDLPAAHAAFERALALAEHAFGPDHPYVARYVNNLGTTLLDMGDAVGALDAFRRAFRIDEQAFGPDHVSVAVRASNLGNVLRLFDDFPEARGAYAFAHDIFLRKLGPDHPNTRTVVANMAALGDHP